MRVLLPLPVTMMTSPLPGLRHVAALQPERLGDAQARAVEQRHHGGVARQIQGSRSSPARSSASAKRLAAASGSASAGSLPTLGARIADEGADLALAFAFKKAPERTQARQRPHQRTPADVVGAAHRHEGPDVGGLQRREALQRDPSPQCSLRKVEALAEVAGIGFQRLRRQPPLGAQMRQPARHLHAKRSSAQSSSIGCSAGTGLAMRLPFGSMRFLEAVIPSDYIAPLSFTVR